MSLKQNYRKYIHEPYQCLRTHGPRLTLKRYGWKLVGLIFTYYLIRDSLIYLVLPALFLT